MKAPAQSPLKPRLCIGLPAPRPASLLLAAVLLLSLGTPACRFEAKPRKRLTLALALFPGESSRYRRFLEDFERDRHVEILIVAETYADILYTVRAEAAAGRGVVDVAELDLALLGAARGGMRRLDGLETAQAQALFPPAAWQAARRRGHLYFVPGRLMWQAMIYNRLEVGRPPGTWEELARFARAHPGKVALKAARYDGLVCDLLPFLWGAGGSLRNPYAPGDYTALSFLAQLAPFLNPYSAVFREMPILEAQMRGEVWIHFNWPFAMSYLASKGLAPRFALSAPIPRGPAGRATVLGGGYLGIPKSAPHPRLARAFLRYLLSASAQRRLSRTLGWYGSLAPEAGSTDAALYAGFVAMAPYVRARPTIRNYLPLSERWQDAVRAVLFAGQSPQAALNELGQTTAASQLAPAAGPERAAEAAGDGLPR